MSEGAGGGGGGGGGDDLFAVVFRVDDRGDGDCGAVDRGSVGVTEVNRQPMRGMRGPDSVRSLVGTFSDPHGDHRTAE